MKMTQAWGWLVAAVVAAGLNASYHNGGLQWAHQIADRVEQRSAVALALASGHANQFLTEARLLTARTETASCPLTRTLARVESTIPGSETTVERFDVMSAREERQLARLEANRARIEARVAGTARIRDAGASANESHAATVGEGADGAFLGGSVSPEARVVGNDAA